MLNLAQKNIPQEALKVLLSHHPAFIEESFENNIALTLAGHTHGGQISIFGIRPTMLFYNEDYGLYEKNDKYIYVTSGIGGLVPFRLGSTPEIAVITLHCFKR